MEKVRLNVNVNDLIVEYMILKIQIGYKPSYTIDEFRLFLNYFSQFVNVDGLISDMDNLFERFFEGKKNDWSINTGIYNGSMNRTFIPHIEKHADILVATNKLSDYDYSILNIRYMSKQQQDYIRNIIIDFLNKHCIVNFNIDSNNFVTTDEKNKGCVIAALFVNSIWNEYVKKKIIEHQWPSQCTDINEYLLDIDLANMIKLPSIKDSLVSFYIDSSRRIANLLHNDPRLEISNCVNPYLPYYNYNNITFGYNYLFDICSNCFYGVSVLDNVFVSNNDKFNKYSNSVITRLDDVNNSRLVRRLNKISDKK